VSREELALEAIKSYQIIGWDAAHGLNAYGHKHWEHVNVQQRDGSLVGVSTAFCSSSDGSAASQGIMLHQLYTYFRMIALKHNVVFMEPMAVVIDKDLTSNQAWRRQFPAICVIYCLYHLYTWLWPVLRTKSNGVPESAHQRIKAQMVKMSAATTKEVFDGLWEKYSTEWGQKWPAFLAVFEVALMDDPMWRDTWVEYQRQHLPSLAVCRTNMLTEAAIRWTKYVQFGGKHNKRMDVYIIEMLNKGAYFIVESAHRAAGLLDVKPKQKKPQDEAVVEGDRLFSQRAVTKEQDSGIHLVQDGLLQFVVRQQQVGESKITLFECTCTPYTRYRKQCSHIIAVKKFMGIWRATQVENLGGRPATMQPRERQPVGKTYKRWRDMPALKTPGRPQGRNNKRSLTARARQERLHQ
jgi:hypothetical protein